MKPVSFCVLILLVISTLSACPILAATIYVPVDQPTIQAGIDAAVDGDLILVAPGTYVENVAFLGKEITVRSESGRNKTVIDGGQVDSVVIFTYGETEGVVIEGFKIRNGHSEFGGGIYCNGSSFLIENCEISDNNAIGDGGGIYCTESSNPVIKRCPILNNHSYEGCGGGIYCSYSTLSIEDSAISQNSSYDFGGGIRCSNTPSTIKNCTITNNHSGYGGGGISLYHSHSSIMNCAILYNHAENHGGGIQYHLGESVMVFNCMIKHNLAQAEGGGIYSTTPSTVVECEISQNQAQGGGGIYCESQISVVNCMITRNESFRGGGVYCLGVGSKEFLHCTISDNHAYISGGGIGCLYRASPTMTNCILWGDLAPNGPELWVGMFIDAARMTLSYCDVQGGDVAAYVAPGSTLYWLDGNIDADPLFLADLDYHLRPGSPCIHAGTDAGVYTDIDGQSRPWGAGFDMGADEFSTEHCSVIASSGNQFVALYLVPALALIFFSRRFLRR